MVTKKTFREYFEERLGILKAQPDILPPNATLKKIKGQTYLYRQTKKKFVYVCPATPAHILAVKNRSLIKLLTWGLKNEKRIMKTLSLYQQLKSGQTLT